MELIVEIKTVYGNEAIYPMNESAQIFAKIAGTKTLTRQTIQFAVQLGYVVQVVTPEFAL